jgi:hypothetical protein
MRYILSTCLAFMALPASADVIVRFIEGAPTDRFVFETTGGCTIDEARLSLDLSGSNAGLIFDVTNAGAGVEVFQPFILVSGADRVIARSDVQDGDTMLSLDVAAWGPATQIAFTIDIDDTIGAREITVSGAEITGATAEMVVAGEVFEGTFNADGIARIALSPCTS